MNNRKHPCLYFSQSVSSSFIVVDWCGSRGAIESWFNGNSALRTLWDKSLGLFGLKAIYYAPREMNSLSTIRVSNSDRMKGTLRLAELELNHTKIIAILSNGIPVAPTIYLNRVLLKAIYWVLLQIKLDFVDFPRFLSFKKSFDMFIILY